MFTNFTHIIVSLLVQMTLLESLHFTKPKGGGDRPKELTTFLCAGGEDEGGEGEGSTYDYSYEATRKSFSEVWEAFLKMKLEVDVYKRALLMLVRRLIYFLIVIFLCSVL